MTLDNLKAGVTTLIMVSLIVAAFAVAMGAFQDDVADGNSVCPDNLGGAAWVFNTSTNQCHNSTINNATTTGTATTYNATQEGLLGISNASSYLSTIGTLIGVAALIAIVIGAFLIVRR